MAISDVTALQLVRQAERGDKRALGLLLQEIAPLVTEVDELNGLTVALSGLGATAAEINQAADRSAFIQELTASGAVTPGIRFLELNHTGTIIAATVATSVAHAGIFIVTDTSASGTAAHTVTLTAGTWHNGSGTVATLNARDEMLVTYFDSAGRGHTIINVGAVGIA